MHIVIKVIHILIGLCLAVPLITIPSHFVFPSIVPKVIVFRIIIEITVALWVLLTLLDRNRFKMLVTPITLSLTLLLLLSFISMVLGVDPYRSFWSTQERMLGLFTFMHYVAFFCIVTTVIKGWKNWRYLFFLFLSVSAIVAIIAIVQKSPHLLQSRVSFPVSSTLGHPSFLSGFSMFAVFISILIFLQERAKWLRSFAVLVCVLNITVIIFTETRGTVLGLVAGFGVLVLCYTLFSVKGEQFRRRILITIPVLVVMVSLVVFSFLNSPVFQKVPTLSRFTDLSLAEGTAGTRLMFWGIAIDAIKEKPIIGWGPNNYCYAFDRFYNPILLKYGIGETWADYAHNVVLNRFTEEGIFGVMAYLLLNIVPITLLWQRYRRGEVNRHITCMGTAIIVSHFVNNLFLFETPVSYLYFILFLAFLNNELYHKTEVTTKVRRSSYPFIAGVAVLSGVLIWFTNVKVAQSNIALCDAMRFVNEHQATPAISTFDRSVKLSSIHNDDARNYLGAAVIKRAEEYFRNGRKDELKSLLIKMYDELGKNKIHHPLDIIVTIDRGQIANLLSGIFNDHRRSKQAEKELEEAVELSPKRQEIRFVLSAIKMNLEKPQEAIGLLQTAIENAPKVGMSWCRLALLHNSMGHKDEARQLIEIAKKCGVNFRQNDRDLIESKLGFFPEP